MRKIKLVQKKSMTLSPTTNPPTKKFTTLGCSWTFPHFEGHGISARLEAQKNWSTSSRLK